MYFPFYRFLFHRNDKNFSCHTELVEISFYKFNKDFSHLFEMTEKNLYKTKTKVKLENNFKFNFFLWQNFTIHSSANI